MSGGYPGGDFLSDVHFGLSLLQPSVAWAWPPDVLLTLPHNYT